MAAAREELRAGALGPRRAAHLDLHERRRSREAPSEDTLLERGIHHFDLWRHFLGSEIVEIAARGGRAATPRWSPPAPPGGTLITGQFSESSAAANELAAYGDAGQLHLSCDRFDGLEVIPRPGYRGDLRVRARAAGRTLTQLPAVARARRGGGDMLGSYAAGWRDLARAIRDGTPADPGIEDGRRAVAMLLAAKESLAAGGAPERSWSLSRAGQLVERAGAVPDPGHGSVRADPSDRPPSPGPGGP